MYVPPLFSLDEQAAWDIVRDAGAGVLIAATDDGLASVFVPVVISDDFHRLTTHVARGNPWWRGVQPESAVLCVFLTASAYVSPSNYPSRFEQPGVVPTWNYVAAEIRGRVLVHDDPDWTLRQARAQTARYEEGRKPQWRVDDSPIEYIEKQARAIVGIEIVVSSIEGKAKLSQNRPTVDHDNVRDNLAGGSLREQGVAKRMRHDQ